MIFDFWPYYYKSCFLFPIVWSIFWIGIILWMIIRTIIYATKEKLLLEDIKLVGVYICALIFLVSLKIGPLYNGGIHLLYEKETDAIKIEGHIEKIAGLDGWEFPIMKSEYRKTKENGYQLSIEGILCTVVDKGDLKIGDEVLVLYLPKSGYVLEIWKQRIDEVREHVSIVDIIS